MRGHDSLLSPDVLVRAYCSGVFPMATHRRGRVQWLAPDPRAILPLEPGAMRVPRSLGKRLRQRRYHLTRDRAFEAVIAGCALPRPDSAETWISESLGDAYVQLHRLGIAHSVEAWLSDAWLSKMSLACDHASDAAMPEATLPERGDLRLAGGLYGVALGGAFFGESMFSHATDASKVCLVHLVEHLQSQGFTLLDVQFSNPHIDQFGVIELPRARYMKLLELALQQTVSWA